MIIVSLISPNQQTAEQVGRLQLLILITQGNGIQFQPSAQVLFSSVIIMRQRFISPNQQTAERVGQIQRLIPGIMSANSVPSKQRTPIPFLFLILTIRMTTLYWPHQPIAGQAGRLQRSLQPETLAGLAILPPQIPIIFLLIIKMERITIFLSLLQATAVRLLPHQQFQV